MKDYQRFKDGLKLVVLYQITLEQMDTFKGTTLYRQSVKNRMNSLEKEIESMVLGPISQLDSINSDLFTEIQEKVELILDMDSNEIAQLKVVIEEHREDQLQEWQQEIIDKETE